MNKEKSYWKAKKVFMKALELAGAKERNREIALLHGYIAESYNGMGKRKKV